MTLTESRNAALKHAIRFQHAPLEEVRDLAAKYVRAGSINCESYARRAGIPGWRTQRDYGWEGWDWDKNGDWVYFYNMPLAVERCANRFWGEVETLQKQAKERYPQGWQYYPGDTCPHGVYVGGCGIDHMCMACEMGDDD